MNEEQPLRGRTIAFLCANEGVEQAELEEPQRRLAELGAETELLAPKQKPVQAYEGLDTADAFPVDRVVAEAETADYDALVLPGGVANPDKLRTDREAVEFISAFVESGRPVAAICHGPWTLIEADAVEGKRLTSWPSLRSDLTNAGAEWIDTEVCIDGRLITSRKPDDIGPFVEALSEQLADRVRPIAA